MQARTTQKCTDNSFLGVPVHGNLSDYIEKAGRTGYLESTVLKVILHGIQDQM